MSGLQPQVMSEGWWGIVLNNCNRHVLPRNNGDVKSRHLFVSKGSASPHASAYKGCWRERLSGCPEANVGQCPYKSKPGGCFQALSSTGAAKRVRNEGATLNGEALHMGAAS